jgi:flagellar motor switch protein FliM
LIAPLSSTPSQEQDRFDFAHPHPHAQTPTQSLTRDAAIEALHAEIAQGLSGRLSSHLRGDVAVAFAFVEAIRYDDFLHSLDETTCLSVIAIDPPGIQACLDLNLAIAYPMIDRLLGGDSGITPAPVRPLTQIERGLVLQIIERAVAEIAQVWSKAMGFAVAVREQALATDPRELRAMPPDEMVHVARFDVRLGGSGGRMSLCLPLPVMECLKNPLPRLRSPAEVSRDKQNLTRNILDAAVELRAMLAETKVRLDDLLTLRVGDLITTEKPSVDEEVSLRVEGKEKFAGRLGHVKGVRAVRITQAMEQGSPTQQS